MRLHFGRAQAILLAAATILATVALAMWQMEREVTSAVIVIGGLAGACLSLAAGLAFRTEGRPRPKVEWSSVHNLPAVTLLVTNTGEATGYFSATAKILGVARSVQRLDKPPSYPIPWTGSDEASVEIMTGNSRQLMVARYVPMGELGKNSREPGEPRRFGGCLQLCMLGKDGEYSEESFWTRGIARPPKYRLEITVTSDPSPRTVFRQRFIVAASEGGGVGIRSL